MSKVCIGPSFCIMPTTMSYRRTSAFFVENNVSIFTGFLKDVKVGADVYLAELKLTCSLRFGDFVVSVYQGELLGFLYALDLLLESRVYGIKILIAPSNSNMF